jgi:hypothetical protein
LSLDHPVDLSVALEAVPEDMLVIGNFSSAAGRADTAFTQSSPKQAARSPKRT